MGLSCGGGSFVVNVDRNWVWNGEGDESGSGFSAGGGGAHTGNRESNGDPIWLISRGSEGHEKSKVDLWKGVAS